VLRPVGLFCAATLIGLGSLTGCGGPDTVAIPDGLIGQPLDEAHRTLEALGFKEFDDHDVIGDDRGISVDSNWVVIATDPRPGGKAELEDTIRFDVGKRDEQAAIDHIPADSPVAVAFAADKAEQARKKAEQARGDALEQQQATQKQRALLQGYVNQLDPEVRLANRVFALIDDTAAGVRANKYGDSQSNVLFAAQATVAAVGGKIAELEPPDGSKRAGTHDDLVAAVERLREATRTLVSAVDAQRSSSVAKFTQVRAEAGQMWNAALTAMYKDSEVTPPLLAR